MPNRRHRAQGHTFPEANFVSAKNGQSLGGPQNMTLTVTGVIIVPEPAALALAGIALAAAAWAYRRRRS